MSSARALAVLALALLACARPLPTPQALKSAEPAPKLSLETPARGSLLRAQDADFAGRVQTYDGRAWVYVESTRAEVKDGRFLARHVPLRPGQIEIAISVTDGRGRKDTQKLPFVVESPARPRAGQLCRPGVGCLRYEERGIPRRDARGHVTNAVVVFPPFGFDERLDELWPDVVGPGRALDPEQHYLLGVAPSLTDTRWLSPDAYLTLVDALFDERELDRSAAIIGMSSYGGELALRALARGLWKGPLMLCGGHDRPSEEPSLQALRHILVGAGNRPPAETWAAIAAAEVPRGYGEGFVSDKQARTNASALGIDPAELPNGSLYHKLTEQFVAQLPAKVPLSELSRRVDAAVALDHERLVYPALAGRRVVLVANRDDQLVSVTRIRAVAIRLAFAGAKISLHELRDPLGHNVFFLRAPLELEAAFATLFTGAEAAR